MEIKPSYSPIDRDTYEKDLRERQRKHLESLKDNTPGTALPASAGWKPCLHDSCPNCHGTGLTARGRTCIHGISCSCPKCAPYAMATAGIASLSTYMGGGGVYKD